jgi:hypothetical protein
MNRSASPRLRWNDATAVEEAMPTEDSPRTCSASLPSGWEEASGAPGDMDADDPAAAGGNTSVVIEPDWSQGVPESHRWLDGTWADLPRGGGWEEANPAAAGGSAKGRKDKNGAFGLFNGNWGGKLDLCP